MSATQNFRTSTNFRMTQNGMGKTQVLTAQKTPVQKRTTVKDQQNFNLTNINEVSTVQPSENDNNFSPKNLSQTQTQNQSHIRLYETNNSFENSTESNKIGNLKIDYRPLQNFEIPFKRNKAFKIKQPRDYQNQSDQDSFSDLQNKLNQHFSNLNPSPTSRSTFMD